MILPARARLLCVVELDKISAANHRMLRWLSLVIANYSHSTLTFDTPIVSSSISPSARILSRSCGEAFPCSFGSGHSVQNLAPAMTAEEMWIFYVDLLTESRD